MAGPAIARRALLGCGAATLVSLGGCLGGESEPTLGEPEPYAEVRIVDDDTNAAFDPPIVHLVRGGMVEWTSEGGAHDSTAYHPTTHGTQRRIPDRASPWSSGPLSEQDQSFEQSFDIEGVYDYACTRREADGMVGCIVVGWPEPEGEPGLAPPADERPPAATDVLRSQNGRVQAMLEAEHA